MRIAGTSPTRHRVRNYVQGHSTVLTMPSGAWDSHMHVTDPERFHISSKATYVPHPAPLNEAQKNAERLSLPNLVFVQPSTYGNDNACLLDALEKVGNKCGRGVVVFDPESIQVHTLEKWHQLGVRGVRINLKSVESEMSPESLAHLLNRYADIIRPLKTWTIQLYADLVVIPQLLPLAAKLGVKIVIDHMGSPPKMQEDMASLKGWQALLTLLEQDNVYVKVSAPYRFTRGLEFRDTEHAVRDLYKARGGRAVVFASDWPHTRFEGADVEPFVRRCLEWCDGDKDLATNLFKRNAERLLDVHA